MSDQPLDLARVNNLAITLLEAIKPELARQPAGNDNVFTVLNALAVPIALVLAGTEFDHSAIEFFRHALARQALAQGIVIVPDWLRSPDDDDGDPDAAWEDEAEGHRLVLMPRYYQDASRVFHALLLTHASASEVEVEGWTDTQRKAAGEWALCVHIAASDNDDVIVPPMPSFLRGDA